MGTQYRRMLAEKRGCYSSFEIWAGIDIIYLKILNPDIGCGLSCWIV
jgi:hypothetical protein